VCCALTSDDTSKPELQITAYCYKINNRAVVFLRLFDMEGEHERSSSP